MYSVNKNNSRQRHIRIRWVTWWPVPYWTDRFNYLASREDVECEVIFLASKSSILDSDLDEASWRFKYKFLRRRPDSTGYYEAKLRFPRPWPIVKGDFDALIMIYADASCLSAALLCWLIKKPYFIFVPNTKYDNRKASKIREWIKKRLFKRATGILATGPLQVDYAMQYIKDKGKVSIIGNPVRFLGADKHISPEVRSELRDVFGWTDTVVLLYVGRLAPEKDLHVVLDALSQVYRRGIKPKLVLVGSGSAEEELRASASHHGLDVEFAGFLQREDLTKRYSAADIFVLPSHSEPWGLVINEAIEFGLPLIVSDKIGSAPVLVQEQKNGYIFPAGNSNYLAASIEALALDPNLRTRMGVVSKEISEKHSVKNWAESVINAIRRNQNM